MMLKKLNSRLIFSRVLITGLMFCGIPCLVQGKENAAEKTNISAEYPTASISNDRVTLVVYLPDAEKGYYRGARFDWSSQVAKLQYRGHNWFGNYATAPHNSRNPNGGTGVSVEFGIGYNGLPSAVGYAEAKPGDGFLKIGVGELRKPEKPEEKGETRHGYLYYYPYEMVRTFPWSFSRGSDWIEFTQESALVQGYIYRLTRRFALLPQADGFVMEVTLENRGSKTINQTAYEHNFINLDGGVISDGWRIVYPFVPRPYGETNMVPYLQFKDKEIRLTRELQGKERGIGYNLEGFSQNSTDNTTLVFAGMKDICLQISSIEPLMQSRIYLTPKIVCPESHIAIIVPPGESKRWQTRYEFVYVSKQTQGLISK